MRVRLHPTLRPLVVAFGLASTTIACGGGRGSPTSPSTLTPTNQAGGGQTTTVVVTALIGGASLAGVAVSANGMSATTDATGTATFNQAIPLGTRATYALGGYRTREAPFRGSGSGETLMFLIPDDVFRGIGFSGGSTTTRLPSSTRLCVVPDAEFRDGVTMQRMGIGVGWAASLPGLAGAGVSVEMTLSPGGNCLVAPIRLKPDLRDSAGNPVDGQAVGTTIYVRVVSHAGKLIIGHELGHVLGFGHSNQSDGLMNPHSDDLSAPNGFNQTEKDISTWLYARERGTSWEDRAPG
ncbi:MAG: hypothetical protein HY824_08310 [Acidobacteria bacterium]|nr:hypothetical protein [Acidobacteriota bacterium]